jgi:hypothetical protein
MSESLGKVDLSVAQPIVSKLIDKALTMLRQHPTNDPRIHRSVITGVLNEYNAAQGQYQAIIDHLETDGGSFQIGVELTHRYLH